jgi:hypothetical protein
LAGRHGDAARAAAAHASASGAGTDADADRCARSERHGETHPARARGRGPARGPRHGAPDAIADRFATWLKNYKAGADKGHGYGVTRLATASDSPVVAYIPQLAVLEKAARQRGAKDFATLSNDDQHALIEAAFQGAKVDRLPDRPEGKHVAADLMAFFFRSSEANDLCYRAEIGKDTCRDLADSPRPPNPLDERAASPSRAATAAPRGDAGS